MNFSTSPNLNILWAELLVEELVRNGIDYFCIAPGSRSAPIAAAAAQNPKVKTFIHYDERGLAFHALGYAASAKRPAVVISTSGTATANFFPAIVECSKKKLPMIVLTADRPPELQKTGASQTIDQSRIYGNYVRFSFDLPCPSDEISPRFVLTTVDQAVYLASRNPGGPVHLNCSFREPLVPEKTGFSAETYLADTQYWTESEKPLTTCIRPETQFTMEGAKDLFESVKDIKNGWIVTGKLSSEDDARAVLSLAQKLHWPVFADISSGMRLGHNHKNLIPYFDLLLSCNAFKSRCQPDGVLHLGGRITSKRWYQHIETIRPKHYIMVLPHPLRNDPLHRVTLRIEGKISDVCRRLEDRLLHPVGADQLSGIAPLSEEINGLLNEHLEKMTALSEPSVCRAISRHIPAESGLFLSNSMPIRDMDTFAFAYHHPVIVNGNRGASGIDGIIASAAGFAQGLKKPVTLVIGDLAFLHDLNSLAMFRDIAVPVIIVVLNNNGGGIFSFLPIARHPDIFEKYFAAPHGLDFDRASNMFGLHYVKPATLEQFIAEYNMAFVRQKSTVIEVSTSRDENLKLHEKIQNLVCRHTDQFFSK